MELTNAQKLVINTKNKSLLVSASAGSGKTFVVVERIVESIKSGRNIDSMLILTFTNAAASELKERIVNKLYDVKEEYILSGDRENAKRIAKQISLVPSADISTIHSFCLSTIRNNFYTLGIDPNVVTLEEPKATLILGECIEELLEEEFESNDEVFLDILDILGNEEQLVDALFKLYKSYVQVVNKEAWIKKIIDIYATDATKVQDLTETDFGKEIVSSIQNALEIEALELERTIDQLENIEDFSTRKDALRVILDRINITRACASYNEIFNSVDTLLSFPTMPRTKVADSELKDLVSDIKNKVVKKLRELVERLIYKDTNGIIQELNSCLKYAKWYTKMLTRLDEKYTLAKSEKGAIDFSDYEHLTLQALKNDEVRQKYIDKYEEIYIDEYQDTSDIQETILMSIARENNVIMVGDVKQSIYGFRNAAPELFSGKYDRLEEIENDGDKNGLNEAKIILAQNFRSRKQVIDATNEVFGKLMSESFGGAKYGKKEELVLGAPYPEADGYIAELHIIERPEKEEEVTSYTEENQDAVDELVIDKTSLELEATAVGKRIQELVNGDFKVYDLKIGEYRPCEYKDIVILMSKVEKTSAIVSDVLGSAGIPTYADSKTGFYKSDEVSLVISFLKVLNNKLDDISLASVLYSVIGKFTLDDLVKIRQCASKDTLINSLIKYLEQENSEDSIKEKINNFLSLLKRCDIYLKTYDLATVVLKLYEETGIYESMRFEKLGALKCANLDAFVQIVADYEKAENTSQLYLLLKYLDVLKAKESSGDSPKLLGENENVVRIMTMHKSKGLEFPVVILMNTASKYNEMDLREKLLTSSKYGIGIDIFDKEKGLTYPSVIKQIIKQDTRNKLRSEALRLLYVAFTRAKEKLIIFGNVPKSLDEYTKGMFVTEGKVSDAVSFTHSSHLKCILQAIYNNKSHIEIIAYNVNNLISNSEETSVSRQKSKVEEFKLLVNKLEVKPDNDKINRLNEKLNLEYGYDIDVEQKYTATKLSKKENNNLMLSELKPVVLDDTVTGTSYGTFIHSVIENIDFTNVTKEHIKQVVQTRANLLNLAKKVNISRAVEQIHGLYERHLKNIVNNAKRIENEFEFVFEDDLKDVQEVTLKTPSLIQGVIDMYVVTKDDKHIIIDFKTDNVQSKEELKDRYKVQLDVYKRAIEVCFNTKIEEVYIYSFKLDEMIKV